MQCVPMCAMASTIRARNRVWSVCLFYFQQNARLVRQQVPTMAVSQMVAQYNGWLYFDNKGVVLVP